MSVTRTPLCTVSYCPEPRNPDWHRCIVCESPYIEHHHAHGRGGMGGSKRLRNDKSGVVAVCHRHHEEAHGIGAATGEGEPYSTEDGGGSVASAHLTSSERLPSPAGVSPELAIDAGRTSGEPELERLPPVTPPSVAPGLGATHG